MPRWRLLCSTAACSGAWAPKSVRALYQTRSAAEQLVAQPDHRVVFAVGDSFLHRDQRVVGDLDVFRAHLGAALGDVAVAQAELFLRLVTPVAGVQWMHF